MLVIAARGLGAPNADRYVEIWDETYLDCLKSKGWERVATQVQADQIAAEARADRLAGR